MNVHKTPSLWRYEDLPSGEPYDWGGAARGDNAFDNLDFHLDLACGRLKKGRFGIDRFPDDGVDWVQDLEADPELPFPDNSIKSVISHHFLEHIGDNFIALMDEVHRVLEPGGVFRIIVPLYPSHTAVADPDHKRYFCVGTFDTFCGTKEGEHWMESFSTPYTTCRFEKVEEDYTPRSSDPRIWWTPEDRRELRIALRKWE